MWKKDKLYDIINLNVPNGYKEFFKRNDVDRMLKNISDSLFERAKHCEIYPKITDVFRALKTKNPRVLILGQDPYHNPDKKDSSLPGSAVGLCFSLPPNQTEINPSFRSIQKEIVNCGFTSSGTGDISRWASDGVILLNSALTVEKSDAGSHTVLWSKFMEELISFISTERCIGWLLWGRDAQSYESSIKRVEDQFIIKSSHPMPLSANKSSGGNPPFFGNAGFNQVNDWLEDCGKEKIDWSIP